MRKEKKTKTDDDLTNDIKTLKTKLSKLPRKVLANTRKRKQIGKLVSLLRNETKRIERTLKKTKTPKQLFLSMN